MTRLAAAAAAPDLASYRSEVVRFLRVCGCRSDAAQDLAQAVYLLAAEKRPRFEHAAAARAWLRRSAQYLLLAERRRDAQGPLLFGHDAEDWLAATERHFAALPDAGGDWTEALEHCTGRLPARQQEALRLYYGCGMSWAEAARSLGLKENGFKMLLQRVRSLLRQCVQRRLRCGSKTR